MGVGGVAEVRRVREVVALPFEMFGENVRRGGCGERAKRLGSVQFGGVDVRILYTWLCKAESQRYEMRIGKQNGTHPVKVDTSVGIGREAANPTGVGRRERGTARGDHQGPAELIAGNQAANCDYPR